MEGTDRSRRPQPRRFTFLWELNGLLGSFLNLKAFPVFLFGSLATFAGLGGFVLGLVEGRALLSLLVSLAVGVVGVFLLLACILEHSKK
ncbi:hypothetical protein [Streptomyces sp. 2112.3]|uniref:hypothetical protein n=1 Tax=Streptomyces sp. 2112.3 TaxID=1881023 RepID=UPI00115F7D47|nr:hypothetical protein [Streptomyces sp. 2112.3]